MQCIMTQQTSAKIILLLAGLQYTHFHLGTFKGAGGYMEPLVVALPGTLKAVIGVQLPKAA